MNISVAADQNWGIGRDNCLLARIPADMKRFRSLTTGKAVVMGRRTWESIPNPPLKGRVNIVLSADESFSPEGAQICRSEDALAERLALIPQEDIFVIGGESVYRLLLPRCERAYVTRFVSPEGVAADRFFPDLDTAPDWHIVSEFEPMESNGVPFRYIVYERI